MSETSLSYKQKDQVPFEYEISDLEKHLKILLSELYSIIVCVDYIEQLHTNKNASLLDPSRYNEKIGLYTAKYDTLIEEIFQLNPHFLVDDFINDYDMKFKYYKGIRRLKHRVSGKNNSSNKTKASESLIFNTNAKLISEVTGNFITIMDALNLNYDKKHQIHPLLSKLVLNLNKVFSSFNKISDKEDMLKRMGDFKENRQLLVDWLVSLNQMNSSDSISKEDGKKLLFDLETAYNKFYDLLE